MRADAAPDHRGDRNHRQNHEAANNHAIGQTRGKPLIPALRDMPACMSGDPGPGPAGDHGQKHHDHGTDNKLQQGKPAGKRHVELEPQGRVDADFKRCHRRAAAKHQHEREKVKQSRKTSARSRMTRRSAGHSICLNRCQSDSPQARKDATAAGIPASAPDSTRSISGALKKTWASNTAPSPRWDEGHAGRGQHRGLAALPQRRSVRWLPRWWEERRVKMRTEADIWRAIPWLFANRNAPPEWRRTVPERLTGLPAKKSEA